MCVFPLHSVGSASLAWSASVTPRICAIHSSFFVLFLALAFWRSPAPPEIFMPSMPIQSCARLGHCRAISSASPSWKTWQTCCLQSVVHELYRQSGCSDRRLCTSARHRGQGHARCQPSGCPWIKQCRSMEPERCFPLAPLALAFAPIPSCFLSLLHRFGRSVRTSASSGTLS